MSRDTETRTLKRIKENGHIENSEKDCYTNANMSQNLKEKSMELFNILRHEM